MDKFVIRIPRVEEHPSRRETSIKPLRQMTIEGLKGVVVMDEIHHATMVLTSSDTSLQQKLESLKSVGSKIPGADIIVSTGIGAAVSSLSNHQDAALAAAASRVQLMWREHLQKKANWRSIDVRYDDRTQKMRDSARKMLHDALKSNLKSHGSIHRKSSNTSANDSTKLFDKINKSLLSDVGEVVSTSSLGHSKGIRIDLDGYDSVMSSLQENSASEENDSDCENVYHPEHKHNRHISSLKFTDPSKCDIGNCTAVKHGKNNHNNNDRLKCENKVASVPCNDKKRKFDLLFEQIKTDDGKCKESKRQHVESNSESKILYKGIKEHKEIVCTSNKDVIIKPSKHDKHKDSKQRKSDSKKKNSDCFQSNRSHNFKDGQHSLCTVSNESQSSSQSYCEKQNSEKNINNFKNTYDRTQHDNNTAKAFMAVDSLHVEDTSISFDKIVKDFSEYLKEDTRLQESTISQECEEVPARKARSKDKHTRDHRDCKEVPETKSHAKNKHTKKWEEVLARKAHSKDKHTRDHQDCKEVPETKSHAKNKHTNKCEENLERKINLKEGSSKVCHKKNMSGARKHRHTAENDASTKANLHHSSTINLGAFPNINPSKSRDHKVSSPIRTDLPTVQKITERSHNEKTKKLKQIRETNFETKKSNVTNVSDAPNIQGLAEALEWKLFSEKRLINLSYRKTVRKLALTLRHQEKVRNKVLSGKLTIEKLIQQYFEE